MGPRRWSSGGGDLARQHSRDGVAVSVGAPGASPTDDYAVSAARTLSGLHTPCRREGCGGVEQYTFELTRTSA